MSSRIHGSTWLSIVLLVSSLFSGCQSLSLPIERLPSVEDRLPFTSNGSPSVENPDWITIETNEEGVYRVSVSDIQEAGLQVATLDPEELVLWRKGKQVPFLVVEQGQALLFYAPLPSSPYSAAEYFWLLRAQDRERIEANLSFAGSEIDPELSTLQAETNWTAETPDRVLRSALLEENKLYTPQVEAGDRWLWEAYSAPENRLFEIDLPTADGGQGRIRVDAWACTEGPGPIDHHWEIWLNDRSLGNTEWDGKGVHQFSLDFPAGVLRPGKNRLEIRTINDTGLKADIVYLDRIELAYTALAQPDGNRMVFQALGESLKIQGYSGEIAGFQFDPGSADSTLLGRLTDGETLSTIPNQHYWLAGANSTLSPHAIRPGWIDLDLLSSTESADYLAIAPQDLLISLDPLLEYHRTEGLDTALIDVESIYNQFTGGYPEPGAIQNFIRYAAKHWPSAPRYLLLVGDSSYDPHGYLGPSQIDQLPTFFVDTIFGGQTASDVPFALVDGDELPDLAVGRIPAQTAEQVRSYVDKTLAYAGKSSGLETTSILAIVDGQDPSFSADASRFLGQFPDPISKQLLEPPAGASNAAQGVIAAIQQGHWLVAYFGHGSIDMWGKDQLLTTADVRQLDDPNAATILVNMTCLTGLFTHPTIESLAEAMLLQESGGAVAVLAPTSLTLPGDQGFLSQALAKALSSSEMVILGDVLLQARRSIPLQSPGAQDVLLTFLLFGDPALRVR